MDTTLAAALPRLLLAARRGRTRTQADLVSIEAFDIRAAAESLGVPFNVSTMAISRAMSSLGAEKVANGRRSVRYAIDERVLEGLL